jgi:putative transposase
VKRVDARRVLNGIFWRLRMGAPWADIRSRYGPHTSCVNRFNRWRRAGVWGRILESVSEAYAGGLSGFPCVGGHNGQEGVPLCLDARSR